MIIMPVELRRETRIEKIAAIRTMAHNSTGMESRLFRYNRWAFALKPACSIVEMNLGSSQKDKVSAEAKLS